MNLNVPEPNYNNRAAKLVNEYKKAILAVKAELNRIDVNDFSKAQSRAVLANITAILLELDETAKAWVEANVPVAMRDGVAKTLFNLGIAGSLQEAEKIVKMNRVNQEMLRIIISDTQGDLLAVTKNIDKKTRGAIRRVFAEVQRSNYTKGINGVRTISREARQALYKELGESLNTGLIDAADRRWRPETYVDTIAIEKMNVSYREASLNEALQRGAYYGIISRHGATDACRFHEGRIIKLTADAPGNYPTIDELKATNQIWHVRCKHHYNVVRNPDGLPEAVKTLADKQAALGNKALAAGGRNPKGIE